MGVALELPVTLTSIDCGNCGGVYAINERYRQQKQEKGGYWRCPYCDSSWGFSKEGSEVEQKRKALEAEQQRHRETLARLNEASAERDRLTAAAKRAKARAHAGLCPCCNRTFQNLARHMATKHKDAA